MIVLCIVRLPNALALKLVKTESCALEMELPVSLAEVYRLSLSHQQHQSLQQHVVEGRPSDLAWNLFLAVQLEAPAVPLQAPALSAEAGWLQPDPVMQPLQPHTADDSRLPDRGTAQSLPSCRRPPPGSAQSRPRRWWSCSAPERCRPVKGPPAEREWHIWRWWVDCRM